MAKFIVINGIKVDKDYANFVPETFGRLTTVGPKFILRASNGKANAYQVCECSCGTIKTYARYNIINGNTSSCGCLDAEILAKRSTYHGLSRTPEHNIWKGITKRCKNSRCKGYRAYGGRGIQMCARWREPNGQGFLNFLEDMGPRPGPEYTVERKNNNGDYCPENCEWADKTQQARNKRNNHMLTYNGKTQCLSAWAEETGISQGSIYYRITTGWSVEDTLTTPIGTKRRNG